MTDENLPSIVEEEIDETIQDDFDYARSSVYNLAEKQAEAIDLMMDLARESEHPRSFEVLSNMIKQNAELVNQLLDMQGKKTKLQEKPAKTDNTGGRVTNNNLFVGSTTELQRFLLAEDEKDVIDHGES